MEGSPITISTIPKVFNVVAEDAVEGTVTKQGTGAHKILPKEWLGRKVLVVLIKEG
ncbi:MAG: DUF2080 family transposase-associated protein [Candidatus Thermoplasmatota archaeon]|nr:DUF2080 family transposase-associated protein [Candidatus Thermoplasmatota archaeon]